MLELEAYLQEKSVVVPIVLSRPAVTKSSRRTEKFVMETVILQSIFNTNPNTLL